MCYLKHDATRIAHSTTDVGRVSGQCSCQPAAAVLILVKETDLQHDKSKCTTPSTHTPRITCRPVHHGYTLPGVR